MLTIQSIAEMEANVLHIEEIRMGDIGRGCVSFCYMIAGEHTFDTSWARECRGIVFSTSTASVVSRPLHKFFNVNEREETRVENINWSKVARVMDKRDGSLIHTVKMDPRESPFSSKEVRDGMPLDQEHLSWGAHASNFDVKSKKTFSSDVANMSREWLKQNVNYMRFCERVVSMDCTAIFEWTAPDARIVLHYVNPELQLLHIRHNETGEYFSSAEIAELAKSYGVTCVDEVREFFNADGSFNARAMMDAAKTREGVEGWVVQFESGDMVKVKTDFYLKRHRAMTFLRERDIAELVLDEGLDDLKSLLVGEGVDISQILKIEQEVINDINQVSSWVDKVISEDGKMERKDFALKYMASHNEFGWFGLLMCKYSGKEPNYKDWYRKNVLKDKWPLRQLVLVPSVAEGD